MVNPSAPVVHEPAAVPAGIPDIARLRQRYRDDKAELMASMLGRVDRLYGDVDVDTIVYEKKQYTCIDLAAHFGSIRCLEWLLAHQRCAVFADHDGGGIGVG